MTALRAPLQAQVVQWLVEPGAVAREGEVVLVLEAMKMEHELRSPATLRVRELLFAPGETVNAGDVLWTAEPHAGEHPHDERTDAHRSGPMPPRSAPTCSA